MTKEQSPIIPLSRLRAQMARPTGIRRLNALISADDPEQAVRSLSIPDLYFLVQDIGLSDSLSLMPLASLEQLQGCVDMDVWERDEMQVSALLPWFAATMDEGYECLGRFVKALDPELIANFFSKTTRIYDHSLGEAVEDDEDRPFISTVDTFFDVVFTTEDEDDAKLISQMIDYMYRDDMTQAQHILMSARSEMLSYLEEMSYRWRSGRMADMGYVDAVDALIAFRPIDLKSISFDESTDPRPFIVPAADADPNIMRELPALLLEPLAGQTLLAKAVELLSKADEHETFSTSLMIVVNHVLAAARVPPGHADAMKLGAGHAIANISLGLETLTHGDVQRSADALKKIPLMQLHRLGFTLTLKASKLARMVMPQAKIFSSIDSEVVEIAGLRHPFFPTLLDEGAKVGLRPFQSLADIATVTRHISTIGIKLSLAKAMGADVVAAANEDTLAFDLDDYVRTAMCKALLSGQSLDGSPLTQSELQALREALRSKGLEDSLSTIRSVITSAYESDVFGLSEVADHLTCELMTKVYDMLAHVESQVIDVKFLNGLLVASKQSN